ncbi:MAG TPA: sulfur carrier protein ThiS [Armatimonadota bacterium]|nr:sulfur carrier protein ThiS [Armatimonadota bacterium]
MQITINGQPVVTQEGITISELLVEQKVQTPEYVSVERNGEILERDAYPTTVVTEGDTIEFLYFMGGGAR